jgi:hypothetical protein
VIFVTDAYTDPAFILLASTLINTATLFSALQLSSAEEKKGGDRGLAE